jgi:glyoxylate reductase
VRVLAHRRLPGPAWDELGDVMYLDGPLTDRMPGAEVYVVVGREVGDATLNLLPDLRLVANYGVGYDGIDVEACAARGVAVSNTPGVLDDAVADLTLALILAVRRRVVEGDAFVRKGGWSAGWSAGQLMGDDVTGATLGIVGLGRIGKAVARRALAFEMRVLYTRRSDERNPDFEYRELDELLREADVVTLHVPLTDGTRGLLDERRLALMREGACLINTARGAIVDEAALVAELASGRLRAGLDVFVHEPHIPPELLELPNVVLQPHVASATQSTREAMTRVLVANVQAALAGKQLPNPVPGSATLAVEAP